MTTKKDYTDQEWRLVVFAPSFAANGVASIDGSISKMESMTITQSMLSARDTLKDNELIQAVLDGFPDLMKNADIPIEFLGLKTTNDVMMAFGIAAGIVDDKAPAGEAREYKQFLLETVEKVAAASGKFLDFFGGNVSAEEDDFIDKLKVALNL